MFGKSLSGGAGGVPFIGLDDGESPP